MQLLGQNRVTGGGPAYLFTLKDGEKSLAVIGAPIESKNRGNRMMILTAFRDSERGIQNWVKRFYIKKEAVSSQGSGGSPANPSPQRDDLLGSENGNKNILNQNSPVNRPIVGRQTQIIGANSREIGRYEVREPAPLTDPYVNLPPELQAGPARPGSSPHGMVMFDAETGRAVVTFFRSADASTAPHELFHIFRREMEHTAIAADGSAHAKEQWRRINEFVGAKEGQAWTEEMEEKFANAGLRYLMEGKAPAPGLRGVFERLKQWFMEIYLKAENIGVEISPQMRQVFLKL